MEKIIMVDGNNLLFRSYYATAYNGNFMKNSKGFPTNGLYGFVNMINKIMNEEKPTHMIVAFDKGKTFRHSEYAEYKGGRDETPDELKVQFPIAKELLTNMGIKYYEIDNYEADDIIGTFAKYCEMDPEFEGLIVSSDKDLLQLISDEVEIKLLKQKDYIRYNKTSFKEDYGIEPIRIIDLKALMGDSSDNIPGVKGIGEKTALKLLQQYNSLDGVYENLNELTPKMREKLEIDKENAYLSYHLATIIRDVPMEINMTDIKVKEKNIEKLNEMYEELEFYSFLKQNKQTETKQVDYKIIKNIDEVKITEPSSIYIEILGYNYHMSKILGIAIANSKETIFIPPEIFDIKIINDNIKYTYDLKKHYVILKNLGKELKSIKYDAEIAGYLLEYNIKDDISYLANTLNYDITFYDTMYKKLKSKEIYEECDLETTAKEACKKAKFIYESKDLLYSSIEKKDLTYLFNEIEIPLAYVLGDMEYTGVFVNVDTLDKMGVEFKEKIDILEQEIYTLTGTTFNIASPKQLGEVLFEKLNLMHGKKNKKGFSTSIDILEKIKNKHPIIEKIIEYRLVTKLYTTYIEGLKNYILEDGKIHTIYTQTLTRTGRLSSIDPNLQNIPIRNEYGRMIRKAFVPSNNSVIVSGDYSQVELRLMAHMANIESLKDAFLNDVDIHTKTASDIFNKSIQEVNSDDRRIAKAVNFGIIYGISKYGLSENIKTTPEEADKFIKNYLNTYPGIKEYMDTTISRAYIDGYVRTLMGRIRTIPELFNKNKNIQATGERIALNTPIQGTCADLIKLAMVEIDKEFKKQNIKSKMILQVHDELVFDCLKEELDKVIEIADNIMENCYKISVPLKVDFEYGSDWYEAK